MAANTKTDFLRECMSDPALTQGPVPIDEFQKAYCVRCIQKDCERARLNGSLFARRTATWKEVLFDKPPRAADDDPRFASIRGKKFLQLAGDVTSVRQGGVNYEVQEREMPAALRRPEVTTPAPLEPELTPPTPATTIVASPPPPPQAPDPAPPPPPDTAPQTRPVAPPAPMQNTPFEQGTVLPGGKPAEKIVEVGGSFTFGGDD